MNELWYDREAADWDEALPLGNGRMGAMVFGGVKNERLALNDDTLWSGFGQVNEVAGAAEAFAEARDAALAGEYKKAQQIIEGRFLGKNTQRYLPLGDLLLEMTHTGEALDYRRALDIENAIATVKYNVGGVTFSREMFISHPAQALVVRISADSPAAVNLTAGMGCLLKHTVSASAAANRLQLEGQAEPYEYADQAESGEPRAVDPARQGMRYIACADFEVVGEKARVTPECEGTDNTAEGAEITGGYTTLRIENADAVIIRMVWRTNFKDAFTPPMTGGVPYRENCAADMARVCAVGYEELKARHIVDYHALYRRVEIVFEAENFSALPLPARLARWEDADPALFALLFQYGRYLMISASRAGSQPMNLQGIWSHHYWPPWSGNFTLNINTEMNYWSAAAANLADCHEPLTAFVRVLRETGVRTAREFYSARGFAVHHNSDIWGMSTPVEADKSPGTARWVFWPLAGGWLACQLFNLYLYTKDEKLLLEDVIPAMCGTARFALDVMVEDTDGTLIFAPSTSPENDFVYEGEPLAVCKSATMNVAIIKEVLENIIWCGEYLKKSGEAGSAAAGAIFALYDEAAEALTRLPAYKTGSRGELLEWSEEFEEYEPSHRHTSHLYPIFPGRETQNGCKEQHFLTAAARRTLDLRGDESTGWALAWRICLFARMGDGERAFSFLKKQLRPSEGWRGGCYPNLFGSHPPFQIDSNFGAVAGICEMLVQSSMGGTIQLLPALPRALGTGRVRGLRAMGGVTVDMIFADGKCVQAVLTLDAHLPSREFNIKVNDAIQVCTLYPGEGVVLSP